MLTLKQYTMGRDKLYPEEWTLEIQANAEDLILRVNNLLKVIWSGEVVVTSGWRPLAINRKAGGAKRSLHMQGKAIDLKDNDGSLAAAILKKPELLLDFGLWLENPESTKGWVHLDRGQRSERLVRIFKP